MYLHSLFIFQQMPDGFHFNLHFQGFLQSVKTMEVLITLLLHIINDWWVGTYAGTQRWLEFRLTNRQGNPLFDSISEEKKSEVMIKQYIIMLWLLVNPTISKLSFCVIGLNFHHFKVDLEAKVTIFSRRTWIQISRWNHFPNTSNTLVGNLNSCIMIF